MATGQLLAGGGTTEQTNFLPGWFEDYQQRALAAGLSQAMTPYTPYAGPRLAPNSADTTIAQNRVRQQAVNPVYGGALGAASLALTAGTATPATSLIPQYMNPYTTGVLDVMRGRANEQFQENVLPQLRSGFGGAGQFGSAREMEYQNRAARDFDRSLMDQETLALGGAFDRALGAGQADLGRMLQGGGALQGLAQQMQSQYGADTAALAGVGQNVEQRGQQSLDLAYGDFMRQQGWNQDQINQFNNMLKGTNVGTGSTIGTTQVPTTQSGLLQLLAGSYGLSRELGKP